MFAEINELKKGLAIFQDVVTIYNKARSAPVQDFLHDGQKKAAFSSAMDLIKFAKQHHEVARMAIDELLDPKTPLQEDIDRLLQAARDHNSELGKFLKQAQAIAGAEFEVIMEAIEKFEAAKSGKLAPVAKPKGK